MTQPPGREGSRVHLVGTPQDGIGAIAELLRAAGNETTVSDGQDPDRINHGLGLLVFAPHASTAPEVRRATELGLACKKIATILAERFLGGKRVLAVAGDQNTTLVAAMCAWILEHAGLEPGFLLRGRSTNFDERGRAAQTRRKILGGAAKAAPFVLDMACAGLASDPEVVLVTSALDDDELASLTRQTSAAGLVACDARDTRACSIVEEHAKSGITTYAIDGDATAGVVPIWLGAMVLADHENGAQPFDLFASGSSCGRFALRGRGADDVRIAVGAIAACTQGFGVDLEKARAALATFEGLR